MPPLRRRPSDWPSPSLPVLWRQTAEQTRAALSKDTLGEWLSSARTPPTWRPRARHRQAVRRQSAPGARR
eukprot:6247395-Lingulodinium_polyedra.AAC.1